MIALRRHWQTATLFLLLNSADLALTCHLLQQSEGAVYEANWVAGAVLTAYGVVGLVVFKAAMVLLAGMLVCVIAAHRPRAAGRLLRFACLAVAGVVLYSVALWGRLAAQLPGSVHNLAALQRESRRLDEVNVKLAAFRALRKEWADALAHGRCTLREALAALVTSRYGRDAEVLAMFDILGGESDPERLAALLVHAALMVLHQDDSYGARSRAQQLVTAHKAEYGPALHAYLAERLKGLRDRNPGAPRSVVVVANRPTSPPALSLAAAAPSGRPRFGSGFHPQAARGGPSCRPVQFVAAR